MEKDRDINSSTKLLSIIIPAYNEEERIGLTIETIISFMDIAIKEENAISECIDKYEIIVVDDGSRDNTISISEKYGAKVIAQPKNMGKGAAVRVGMLSSEAEFRLFSDADLSTPIKELILLFSALEENSCDIAIGSRGLDYGKIKKHQPFYREFMGKTFNKIVSVIAFEGIKDTQCGFKLFRGKVAQDIFSKMTVNGFGFDVEALYIANKLNYKIAEIPVEWHNDDRTKVNPIIDPIKMLLDISKLRRTHKNIRN